MKQISEARIMIVDDNPQNIQVLATLLEALTEDLTICTSGEEALEALAFEVVDLILLDIMMPVIDGYEVCRRIRKNDQWSDVPIIFITAKSSSQDIILGFEVGGNDYVTKPFNEAELMARVKNQLEFKRMHDALITRNQEMEILIQKLAIASATDALTGLLNRRAMTDRIGEEIARFKRYLHPFALAMVDIDYFKRVNDQYGHDCGDQVLIGVANCLRDSVRQIDMISRWGGEEFLLLFSECGPKDALNLAERVRQSIAATEHHCEPHDFHITITLGLVNFSEGMSFEDALQKADKALYQGKLNGRNQVYVASGGSGADGAPSESGDTNTH